MLFHGRNDLVNYSYLIHDHKMITLWIYKLQVLKSIPNQSSQRIGVDKCVFGRLCELNNNFSSLVWSSNINNDCSNIK